MKKIIGIIFISLMFCNIGFSEIKIIEQRNFIPGEGMKTVCVDGYKFVVYVNNQGTSIVQAFRVGGTSPNRFMALPEGC